MYRNEEIQRDSSLERNDSHAWKNDPNESNYIMNRNTQTDPSIRHVMDVELSRLNHGNGVRLPTNNDQVEIVDPNKSRQYKEPLNK